MKACSYSLKSC